MGIVTNVETPLRAYNEMCFEASAWEAMLIHAGECTSQAVFDPELWPDKGELNELSPKLILVLHSGTGLERGFNEDTQLENVILNVPEAPMFYVLSDGSVWHVDAIGKVKCHCNVQFENWAKLDGAWDCKYDENCHIMNCCH